MNINTSKIKNLLASVLLKIKTAFSKIKISKKKVFLSLLGIVLFLVVMSVVGYEVVSAMTKTETYDDVKKVPYNEVGMLLGTNPKTKYGARNPYFYNRIKATVALYKAKKIKFVLISGDNGTKEYSEPDVMRQLLIDNGIPKDVIYIDYAGFRTLDSVVRSKKIFGQKKMTVISQRFHNERCIVLGKWQDMDLAGYNAKDTNYNRSKVKMYIRECLARVKMIIDIAINKEPKFLGDPIKIAKECPQKGLNKGMRN